VPYSECRIIQRTSRREWDLVTIGPDPPLKPSQVTGYVDCKSASSHALKMAGFALIANTSWPMADDGG
jgi:hypothetical protein